MHSLAMSLCTECSHFTKCSNQEAYAYTNQGPISITKTQLNLMNPPQTAMKSDTKAQLKPNETLALKLKFCIPRYCKKWLLFSREMYFQYFMETSKISFSWAAAMEAARKQG